MLLFSDGFESFDITDIKRKWGVAILPTNLATDPEPYNRIVSGVDATKNPPQFLSRKGGRALQVKGYDFELTTPIKKSRSVFVGFALRSGKGKIKGLKVAFYSMVLPNKSDGTGFLNGYKDSDRLVAECELVLNTTSVFCNWTFPDPAVANQTSVIDISLNPKGGEFVYYQTGITLNGNAMNAEDRTAWVENRLGTWEQSRRIDNIATAVFDSDKSHYINAVSLYSPVGNYINNVDGDIIQLDDVYICNDEGPVNNTFLGDVRIKRMTPSIQGTINNGVSYNFTGSRHNGVSADFINTVDALPNPLPDPEQNPMFIPWVDPRSSFLQLRSNATQLFQFTHPDYEGAQPKILGVVATVISRCQTDIGKQSEIEFVRKIGSNPQEPADNSSAVFPVSTKRGWESTSLGFDNNEMLLEGRESLIWSPLAVNNSEWGIRIKDWDRDPSEYIPGYLRHNIKFEDILHETIYLNGFSHRFWDRMIDEGLVFVDVPDNAWATFAYDTLSAMVEMIITKRGLKGIDERLYIQDEIPWQYFFLKEVMGLSDDLLFAWAGDISDSMGIADDSIDKWVEEVADGYRVYGSNVRTDIGENLYDVFSLEEPLVWDNHETLEDSLEARVSYVWSAHELVEEYLWYQEYSIGSHGERVEEVIGFIEDHFDGWWVEELRDPLSIWFTGITQHWRYEWFMGVIINSIRFEPIEDTGQWGGDGMDGYRTGFVSWN